MGRHAYLVAATFMKFEPMISLLWIICDEALFLGVVLTCAIFNFQLLYFEQDANGGYGLALQVKCINISDALVSQALVLIVLFIYCFICIF